MSGGAHTSRTMMLTELRSLLSACPETAVHEDYKEAVIDRNVLGKQSQGGRERSFRYLRELYALRSSDPRFRALRTLWALDAESQPLLALLCALGRDDALRGTAGMVLDARPEQRITSEDLADAVSKAFPGAYKPSVVAKVGRNALSSWTQSGHLAARGRLRLRTPVRATPVSSAYALYLGHLDGLAGQSLFTTLWVRTLDASPQEIEELTFAASVRGWLTYRHIGSVIEVDFEPLTRAH